MTVKPIPSSLLGDEIVVMRPGGDSWTETCLHNERAERINVVEDGAFEKAREKTELYVWIDFANSYPLMEIWAGMRAKYRGEVFEITKVKTYRAESPHHRKFTAMKIGDDNELKVV